VILAPITLVLNFIGFEDVIVFLFAVIALVPLAKLIGGSTEHLSSYHGPTVGSLLNVTFG
jgi:Ca2+:H+ antiporter